MHTPKKKKTRQKMPPKPKRPRLSREYELFVREVIKVLHKEQGHDTIKVEHDCQVQGISQAHQVDVYWEFRTGGVTHRVIVNCKRYKDRVEVTDVETLAGVLHDVPGAQGMIVTTVGYQSGALAYAETHRITLKVIRKAQDEDYEGRIRQIGVNMNITVPHSISASVDVDKAWCDANIPEAERDAHLTGGIHDANLTQVHDLATGDRASINDLLRKVVYKKEQGHRGGVREEALTSPRTRPRQRHLDPQVKSPPWPTFGHAPCTRRLLPRSFSGVCSGS